MDRVQKKPNSSVQISDQQKSKLAEEITRTLINSFFQFQSVGAALSK
jgi:phenylpyruvate tautomerase PptA (4-oxalocrotonate tautomerase family)